MNRLDVVTGRPIGEWRVSPPEIVVAANGYVLRTYDVQNDHYTYEIAANADEVRAALLAWADKVATQLREGVERTLAGAAVA